MNDPHESDKNRFVVLFHEFPPGHKRENHWDLMLERGDELSTWALSEMPALGKSIPAQKLADHRRSYLQYEGPVSGDRGSVTRVMNGNYFWLTEPSCCVLESNTGRWELEFVTSENACLIIVS